MFDPKDVLGNLFDGAYTVSRNRRITYWNKAAEEITGYAAAEVMGTHCYDGKLQHVDDKGNNLCNDGCPLSWAMAHRQKHETEVFLHHKKGHRVPIQVRVSPLYDSAGEVNGAVELFSDVSPKESAAQRIEELEQLAMIDPLTRLANQNYLESQLEAYQQEMHRQPIKIGVLAICIDDLEHHLEQSGAEALDRYRQVVAETIRSNSRPLDLFGHLEGGLFLGLIRNVSSNALYTVAEKLRQLIGHSDLVMGDRLFTGTVSIGGSIVRADDRFVTVLARCRRQLKECAQRGGNRSSIEIRFHTV